MEVRRVMIAIVYHPLPPPHHLLPPHGVDFGFRGLAALARLAMVLAVDRFEPPSLPMADRYALVWADGWYAGKPGGSLGRAGALTGAPPVL